MAQKLSLEAQAHKRKYVNGYIADNYDRINILFPSGTRARIEAAAAPGQTVSAFVREAIEEKIERIHASAVEDVSE